MAEHADDDAPVTHTRVGPLDLLREAATSHVRWSVGVSTDDPTWAHTFPTYYLMCSFDRATSQLRFIGTFAGFAPPLTLPLDDADAQIAALVALNMGPLLTALHKRKTTVPRFNRAG